jgi:DNA-binding response OmpR family regulator
MDLEMPFIDRWQPVRRLKKDPQTSDIPIIGMSAHALASEREKAIATGCVEFDAKPIEFEGLVATILHHSITSSARVATGVSSCYHFASKGLNLAARLYNRLQFQNLIGHTNVLRPFRLYHLLECDTGSSVLAR